MANGDIEVTSTAKSPTAVSSATSTVTAVTGAVGAASALASLAGFSIGTGAKLPLTNALNKYASVTQIFTLAALDKKSLNSPNTTYMKGGKLPIVFKTAGGSPNNRVKTKFGRFDFYVDELVIDSVYGFMQGTGNTNATTISMTVSEPYSMGMFPISLNQAAYDAGYNDFRSCSFLLKIEFKGEDQNGNMVSIKDTTRFIPLTFRKLAMSVNEGGSVYKCDCIPSSDVPLLSSNCTITTDITITGSTVAEILQTGPRSLQAVLNRRLQEIAKKAKAPVPDEIVILFPSASNMSVAAQPGEDEKTSNQPATAPVVKPKDDAEIFKELNVKRSSINNTLIQSAINEIGACDLGYSETRKPKTSAVDPSKAYNEQGYLEPSKINKNPKISDYVFKQASTIQNAINQVILTSDYGVKALKAEPDGNGMRTWWRIETSLYHIDGKENFDATGRPPQVLVYKVVPYKVHATSMPVPGQKSSKFKSLLDQCVKVYNYLYTGKNTDILRFNLDFDNRFVSALSSDVFGNTASIATAEQDGSTKEKVTKVDPNQKGTPGEQSEGYTQQVVHSAPRFSTDGKGKGGVETSEIRAARAFHDAITFGIDLQKIEMEIVGDPYWLTGNGLGNYTAPPTSFINLSKDGSVNYQNGEVDMAINFRTPIDINPVTGLYNMAGKRSAQFSGLYRVQKVTHTFREGQFTQLIKANRRQISPKDTGDVNFNVKKTEQVTPNSTDGAKS